jgi:hypothetical protein
VVDVLDSFRSGEPVRRVGSGQWRRAAGLSSAQMPYAGVPVQAIDGASAPTALLVAQAQRQAVRYLPRRHLKHTIVEGTARCEPLLDTNNSEQSG